MNYFGLALRSLRKSPGHSVAIVLLLGLGIGANTALFSMLQSILLRPVAGVERARDLIRIRRTWNGQTQSNQSYPDYLDVRDRSKTLGGLIAERNIAVRRSGPPAQMVAGAIVTGNYFQVLGVKAAAGRLFGPDDDRLPGAHPVIVISEAFWRREYGRDSRAVGRTILLNGYPFTITGVAAAPFEGVAFGEPADLWMPMMMVRTAMTRSPDYHWLTDRRAGWLTWYARLKTGIAPSTAAAELNLIAKQIESLNPDTNGGRNFEVSTPAGIEPEERARLRSLLGLLATAAGLVLLIACGNVANLLLARAAARFHEMAIRLALGAGRRTLLAQLLSENLLLGLAGGLVGLLLAPWMQSILRRAWDPRALAANPGTVDGQLLGFTLAVSLLAVVLCGLAPGWMASRMDAGAALKTASPRAGGGRHRLQKVWVVAQVALSVALVAAGSIVWRSMQRILAIDPGYQPGRVIMAGIDLSLLGYSEERGTRTFRELLQHASSFPGVRSASLAKSSPATDWSDRVAVFRAGDAEAGRADRLAGAVTADRNTIAPDYFRTLEIPMIAGRDFTLADRSGERAVAIVGKSLADRLWHGGSALGRQIVVPVEGRPLPGSLDVIGIAADSRYRSVLDTAPPILYVPLLQNYDSISHLMVALDAPPAESRSTLRRIVEETNADLPVHITTMREQLNFSLWRQRAATLLLAFFGVLAIALACAGINGVVAYGARQRTREIGIRMALGARRSHVLWQVVGQATRLTGIGIALGLPLALWARPALAALLYEARGIEPVMALGVPVLFLAVAVAASFRPARRAAATDPVMALRQE